MLKKILSVIAVVFILFNIVWGLNRSIVYNPFKEALGGGKTMLNEGDYCYGIGYPKWPEFTGNLYITENMNQNEDSVDILIWPSYDGSLEIGISVFQGEEHTGEGEDAIEEIAFMVDEQMNLLDYHNPEIKKVYEEHQEDIRKLFRLAYQKWGILQLED